MRSRLLCDENVSDDDRSTVHQAAAVSGWFVEANGQRIYRLSGARSDRVHAFISRSAVSCDTVCGDWWPQPQKKGFRFVDPLDCRGNYSATSNNMYKLVHWPLMLHLGWWAVTFGTARRGLGGADEARPGLSSLYQM